MLEPDATGAGDALARIDTSIAHPARRYNYWLGGKDHFAADRASGDRIAAANPTVRIAALENRAFLGRAVQFLVEAGIRQFLDIGSGLPFAPNVHDIAQRADPTSRVVYVDNDPIVLTHARALLTGTRDGHTAYLDADLRHPGDLLARADLHTALDLAQPVGLLLVAVLHFLPDTDDPHHIVDTLLEALAPGSYLVLSHATADYLTDAQRAGLNQLARGDSAPFCPRTATDIASFAHRGRLIPPGLVSVARWHEHDMPGSRPADADVGCYGFVAHLAERT